MASQDMDSKIQEVYKRIQKERKMVDGFRAMAAATANMDTKRSCEAKVRESEKSIQWFEQSLRELQKKRGGPGTGSTEFLQPGSSPGSSMAHGSASTSSLSSSPYAPSRTSTNTSTATSMTAGSSRKNLPPTPGDFGASGPVPFDPRFPQQQQQGRPSPHQSQHPYGQQQTQYGQSDQLEPYGTFNNNGSASLSMRRKQNFTNLDLIKYETPLNSAKISKMLNQLEFKLRVEKEYMQGIEKMAKLYQVEGDKKARQDAEAKRIESKGKKDLLETALKRYKTLDIMGGVFDEEDGLDDDAKGLNRKPLSGTLQITVKAARDLDHLPSNKRKPMETVVVVKVEDTPRARTHPSRTDRWNEEFELHVDKANEVEVTIYDKGPGANETPTPIGMLWIRLSDVVDELRRKKVGAEAGAGWVTAAGVEGGHTPPGGATPGHHHSGSMGGTLDTPVASHLPPDQQSAALRAGLPSAIEGIDSWFTVEPAGQIDLHLNFIKSNVRKRPYDAGGLGRQGAVRKRKEEIHEQNGHKFVQRQFYGVVLCAFCQEFLLKAAGMQCEDCRFTCHKKCYDKVVTKCVSKSNAEADKDGDKINHRIPHRFEPITTLSPSWCCHCGQIVPLTRKKARRCTECGLSCHADCAHLVPDFCGMSMEMARQLIGDIRTINKTRSTAVQQREQQNRFPTSVLPPARQGPFGQQQPPSSPSRAPANLVQQDLVDGASRMQIDGSGRQGGRPPPPSVQMPAGQESKYPAAGGQQQIPPSPQQQQQQQRMPQPSPGRVPVPQDSREQYPLPAAAAPLQQAYPLPAGATGPPAGQYPDYGSQPQGQSPFRQGAPSQSQRPYPALGDQTQPNQQQQQPSSQQVTPHHMQGPRPMSQHQQPASQQGMDQQRTSMVGMPSPQQFQQQQQQQPAQHLSPQQSPVKLQQQLQQQQQQQLQQRQSYIQQQQGSPMPSPGVQPQTLPSTPTKVKPVPAVQQQQQQLSHRKVGLDDFNFLAVLGKGNFGKVMLAEEKRSNKLWAIKVLKKEFIIENDEIESTKSEKRVFLCAARERHPFLLDLHSCFQTETRIYFVMEYISGGDLMLHIQREHFTPRRARFYAAEILLALEYFHSQGIIYRDLKLDNILLTLDGHVKLADYGLCKENMWYNNTTSTFCGTPEFMAPEILKEQRYGRAVDWWAFGVLIYEMLLGQSPFRGDDEDEIFDAILEDEPLYPIHMPHASVSILQQLLCRDPARRLGAGPDDAEEIKRHVFFKDINWDDIMAKKVPAPYYPKISGPLDLVNFDDVFTKEQPTLTPVHSQLSSADQKEFREFSWIGPAALEGY